MRRLLIVCAAVAVLAPLRADALTVRDVIELSRAGLGEETLLALIEVDPSVFPIDTATLKSLKAAGVSERVIVAMVHSARVRPEPPPDFVPDAQFPAQPVTQPIEPQVVVIDHHDAAPQVREFPVAVPVYIPVERHRRDRDGDDDGRAHHDGSRGHGKAAEPVYWGFGGKLRPDAWQPK
jgi:hypothetical protein